MAKIMMAPGGASTAVYPAMPSSRIISACFDAYLGSWVQHGVIEIVRKDQCSIPPMPSRSLLSAAASAFWRFMATTSLDCRVTRLSCPLHVVVERLRQHKTA